MRKHIKVYFLLCLIPFLTNFAFAEKDIIIESRLFKGVRQEVKSGPEVIISSFSEPFIIPLQPSNIESESKSISYLKNELNNIYQLKNVDHIATGNMIWDGKKKNLNGTVLLEEFIYPINFSPRMFSKNNVNLRIEIFKFKGTEIPLKADEAQTKMNRQTVVLTNARKFTISKEEGEKLLDTEITINFDEPVVLGFPSNGNPYFLSIYITKKKIKGRMREVFITTLAKTDVIQLPRPIRKVTPIYPEKCKKGGIEGLVVLEVTTDKEGNVEKVRVLKDAHPELDREARKAIRQWKYEPVFKDGKSVPAMFAVAVDFKLRKATSDENLEFPSENQKDLETILRKCAEYCEKLANSALFFVCREKIKEVLYQHPQGMIHVSKTTITSSGGATSRTYRTLSQPRTTVNKYVYDYQLVKKGEKIEESRTLLKENGEKKDEKNAILKTQRFYSERSAFGPIGLLSREWQDMYNYKIIKEKTIDGREAFVIEAKPKKKIEEKPNYGKIWIAKEDFSIIRIEIEQESLAGFEKIKEEIKKRKIKPIITVTHDYGIKKDGIRFPSKTTFMEDYFGTYMGRSKRSRMFITYDNYRFFTVDVEVKY